MYEADSRRIKDDMNKWAIAALLGAVALTFVCLYQDDITK